MRASDPSARVTRCDIGPAAHLFVVGLVLRRSLRGSLLDKRVGRGLAGSRLMVMAEDKEAWSVSACCVLYIRLHSQQVRLVGGPFFFFFFPLRICSHLALLPTPLCHYIYIL
ncbi:uncharacterized protein K452DRAFT_120868 [Aplosporella prunicola CBS 121167]|uniref:Uncharacterized protein n=1 Tax=Aplosporella prunicola CBS 121167 TaxID=1176127 RepID=A0A6A6BMZ5_9PEZI|nr:uncharacterized protein K452DRAFT_120868 [Aplosporella prunicola CBS 121167]KAF2145502.1 hypothetical protein K452DRAFT_120868 [Aplosporella prunicola CBS 121167]